MNDAKDVGFDTDKIYKRIRYLKREKTVLGRLVNWLVSIDKETKKLYVISFAVGFGLPFIFWFLRYFF